MKLSRRRFLLGTTAIVALVCTATLPRKPAIGGIMPMRELGLVGETFGPEMIVPLNSTTAKYVSAGTATVLGYNNVRVFRVVGESL